MLEDTKFSIEELYTQWTEDPSSLLVEDILDRWIFCTKSMVQMQMSFNRRLEMMEERFNKQEGRIAQVTTELATWRNELRRRG